jgi:hypothetical protein
MTSETSHDDCCEFPDLRRPNYFFGQLLGVREFRGEQSYFREKIKLLNRTLHGHGVVCGLLVTPSPADPDCVPSKPSQERERLETEIAAMQARADAFDKAGQPDEAARLRKGIEVLQQQIDALPPAECVPSPSPTLRVDCGMALDCDGNELLLHRPAAVDPLDSLSDDERKKLSQEPGTVYVTICYCGKPIEPSRPLQTQECGITSECEFGWTLDTVRLHVTTTKPDDKQRCNPCCKCEGGHACLLLAVIEKFDPGKPIAADQIQNGVRRALAVYDPVRISGISWAHGGLYTRAQAKDVLGGVLDEESGTRGDGLQIRLTRPIRTASLSPGVLDVWVIEGGGGRAGNIYELAGDFVLPSTPFTDLITYQQRSDEVLQEADRVLITLRCEFLLDECCRAVDGSHVGGRVPRLPGSIDPDSWTPPDVCVEPTRVPGPWQSGNQTEGSNFVSWFFIRREKKAKASA